MVNDLQIILRLVLASILGGLIGLEREIHGREAGVRTYLLVSVGSALIMIISEHLLLKYDTKIWGDLIRGDPGRIAAQAITGIGFLGAGVIIRYKDSIRGLTTAACMWVVCAIGLTVGAGYYFLGSIATAITLFALTGLKLFTGKLSRDWYKEMVIVSEDLEGQVERIQELIDKYNIKVSNFSLRKDMEKKEMRVNFKLRLRTIQPDRAILKEVFKLEGVKCVDLS